MRTRGCGGEPQHRCEADTGEEGATPPGHVSTVTPEHGAHCLVGGGVVVVVVVAVVVVVVVVAMVAAAASSAP